MVLVAQDLDPSETVELRTESMNTPTRRRLNRLKLLRLLETLEATPGRAVTLYFPPGLELPEIDRMLAAASVPEEAGPETVPIVARSRSGSVLFWGEQEKYLVLPPFPVAARIFSSGYDVGPLRALVEPELTVALILVRLGAYAVGVFRGETLLSSKVGTGHIHARHRKGGSSQRRFERGREKEIEQFFERVCSRVREHIEPHLRHLDYVVLGGERHTLLAFRRRCQFLEAVQDRTLESLLNVREPKQASLEAAIDLVWSSAVIQWSEDP